MVIDLFGLDSDEVRRRFPEVYQHLMVRLIPERDLKPRERAASGTTTEHAILIAGGRVIPAQPLGQRGDFERLVPVASSAVGDGAIRP